MTERRHLWNWITGRKKQIPTVPRDPKDPLKQEELRAIRARERAATGGPWSVRQHPVDDLVTDRSITTSWEDAVMKWPRSIVGTNQSERGFGTWIEPENAEFIAHARTDIPSLLMTLDVFADPKVYDALLRFLKSDECPPADRVAIERALDVAWNLMKSQP